MVVLEIAKNVSIIGKMKSLQQWGEKDDCHNILWGIYLMHWEHLRQSKNKIHDRRDNIFLAAHLWLLFGKHVNSNNI